MSAINDWMARRSGIELFFIFGVFFGVIFSAIESFGGLTIGFVAAGVGGALFGGLMTAITLWGRRQSGGQRLLVQMNSAISSGELPELIDPTAWLTQLNLRLVNLHRARVSVPVVFGIIVVSELFVGLTGPRPNYAILFIAVVVAFLAVAAIVTGRRRIPKLEALAARIRETYNLQDTGGSEHPPSNVQ